MRTVLTAAELWDGGNSLPHPAIEIEDGRIASIGSRSSAEPLDPLAGRGFRSPASILSQHGAQAVAIEGNGKTLHFPGATLAPAFFDVHIHGAAGHDAMEATPEALSAIGRFLAAHGTANYLATTVTAPVDATLRALERLARLIERPELVDAANASGQPVARAVGIHLEGPFLSHARRGVQPAEHLLAPDIALFDWFFDAANGHIRLMTLAPELDGAVELIRHATARGVRVSLGHSDATAAETRAAISAGAVSATHTFNAMRALNHHEPGILGAVLTDDSLFAELICDGIHNAPEMVKLWWRAKGPERGILVTDAMSAAGMPEGEYRLGELAVRVANGRAMVGDILAGSVLTLDRALENFVAFTGAPVEEALRLATANPAAMTGMGGEVGKVAVGGPANLVAVDASGRLVAAILNGRPVEGVRQRTDDPLNP
ncbi:MAG: N-acetylglucosamine-6-phosphate deacetylase [Terracidiphilus sp.]|jgi:N-acetylglucosamine-6-phosphate deacetylase